MSGGAAAAAAAQSRFFDGDADALLMLSGIKTKLISLPLDTGRIFAGTGITFSTGGHAVMIASGFDKKPLPQEFTSVASGNVAADFVELACGALLESQVQFGSIPGYNYPRTLLVGPRAAFGYARSTLSLGAISTWADTPKMTQLTDANRPEVFDYDRVIFINHLWNSSDKSTVVITFVDLDQSSANDAGVVPAMLYSASFSNDSSLPYASGQNPATQMKAILGRLGMEKRVKIVNEMAPNEFSTTGIKKEYHEYAVLVLERIMRHAVIPRENRMKQLLEAQGTEETNMILMKHAVLSGFVPPRTISENPVSWPSPTTQDDIVKLIARRRGVARTNASFSGAFDAQEDYEAAARAILGITEDDTMRASTKTNTMSYGDFAPPDEDWY